MNLSASINISEEINMRNPLTKEDIEREKRRIRIAYPDGVIEKVEKIIFGINLESQGELREV